MRVGVHRDANFRVPEYLHGDPIRNALGEQQRCTPMPQVMQPKPVQASPPPQLLPPSVHVARLNWYADQGGAAPRRRWRARCRALH
jgi:hypothetical protein